MAAEEPLQHSVHANEIDLCAFEWGRAHRGRGPTLLLAHATGFHARCWDPMIRCLGDRHVIALDQRGHGRSERTPITHWGVFGEDLAAFARALGLERLVGVGHSMGGHAMVDAMAKEPERFLGAVLVDPVIAAAGEYPGGGWSLASGDGGQTPLHPTAKRKRHFASPEAMIERFRDREPYRVFTAEALEAYCTFGLLPAEGGGFELACPPEIEASIYMTSRTNGAVHDSVAAIRVPVLILRSRPPPADRAVMDFSSSPTWADLVNEFRHGRDIHFADRTHFLPMEIPAEIAALVIEQADAVG